MIMRNELDNFYTFSEKTVKKYTVYQALQSAISRLKGRTSVNTTSIKERQYSEKITLKELNEIADQIVWDSKRAN